ncbi:Uncharacterised protein [Mycobacteroides abscessus subsp. abscessus]|nr:Uncharacterised protein [Mycobacteroides abscessus subsp. abscessus]
MCGEPAGTSRTCTPPSAANESSSGSMGSGSGSCSPRITSRHLRTNSPISDAFQSPHTPGPVASESASASCCSSSRSSRSPPSVLTTASMVSGSARSRRVAVLGSSR